MGQQVVTFKNPGHSSFSSLASVTTSLSRMQHLIFSKDACCLQNDFAITGQHKNINNTGLRLPLACLPNCIHFSITFKLWRFPLETKTLEHWNEWPLSAVCSYHCQFKMVFLAAFLRYITTSIFSHLPQNILLFWQLGILVMWFASFKQAEAKTGFYSQIQIILRVMLLKISNAIPMYFLGFPYMLNVFAIVRSPLTGCYGMSMGCVIVWLWVSDCQGVDVWLGLIQGKWTHVSIF